MKIAAMEIRGDETRILVSRLNKNTITPEEGYIAEPVLEALLDCDEVALAKLFVSLRKGAFKKANRVYVSLPTALVKMNCGVSDYEQSMQVKTAIERWKQQILDIDDIEKYDIDTPLILQQQAKLFVTAAGIEKRYIDTLFNAAMAADVNVMAIEPAAIAVLRYLERWKDTFVIVEYEERFGLNFTLYSPSKGIFSMNDALYTQTANVGARLSRMLPMVDFCAQNIYDNTVVRDVGIYNTANGIYDITATLDNRSYVNRIIQEPEFNRFVEGALERGKSALYGVSVHRFAEKENAL